MGKADQPTERGEERAGVNQASSANTEQENAMVPVAHDFDLAAYVEQALVLDERSKGWQQMAAQEEDLVEQTHALRRAIEEDKQQINDALEVLEQELTLISTQASSARAQLEDRRSEALAGLERLGDWKGWVRENPWKAVGVGFAVGIYFGSMVNS